MPPWLLSRERPVHLLHRKQNAPKPQAVIPGSLPCQLCSAHLGCSAPGAARKVLAPRGQMDQCLHVYVPIARWALHAGAFRAGARSPSSRGGTATRGRPGSTRPGCDLTPDLVTGPDSLTGLLQTSCPKARRRVNASVVIPAPPYVSDVYNGLRPGWPDGRACSTR